tara:strand:+ start:297 stop:1514 length:1218 start_codon:yes stop_codon:yes gene_type:complete
MARVKQGLKSLAESSPDLNNNAVNVLIADTNLGYATISYSLAQRIRTNTVLTESQKTDLKNTINNKPYLNIGQLFDDLDTHTDKILTGELGDENVAGSGDRGTFLEHMQLTSSIESLVSSLFGNTADNMGKGVDDHFGTLRLSIRPNMNIIRDNLRSINNSSLPTDTAYRTAMTNLINFLDSVKDDSTDFQQTLNTFASAVSTAQTNLDGALASEPYLTWRTAITTNRNTINNQITKEITNIGGIRAYVKSLVETQSYVSLAENTKLNDIIRQSSGSSAWQDYYSKYDERKKDYNPIYNFTSDSSNDTTVEQVLRLRGLPDVLNHHDLESVAKKLLRDTRLSSVISNQGKTVKELIEKACQLLSIEIEGRDVYSQSKLLLDNMNKHDIDSIKKELENSQATDTLS